VGPVLNISTTRDPPRIPNPAVAHFRPSGPLTRATEKKKKDHFDKAYLAGSTTNFQTDSGKSSFITTRSICLALPFPLHCTRPISMSTDSSYRVSYYAFQNQ
jgi:hypothetical protein